MKALVTGATGFLGGHLVSLLSEKGYQVIAVGRNIDKGRLLSTNSVNFKFSDITDKKSILSVFESVDVVFHCAALSSAWGSDEDFYRANVVGTRNVLHCCQTFKVKRLVFVSSTSVYFDFTDKTNIKEHEALTSGFANSYARSKYQAEQLLIAEKKATEVVIIRPRGIIGEGDTAIMPRILRVASKGYFPLINQGRALVDVTYVKNVAYALLLAGEATNFETQVYNVSNNEPMSIKSLLNKVFEGRRRKVKLIPVSYVFLLKVAHILEVIYRRFNLPEPKLTQYGVGLLSKSQVLNTDAIQRDLGYQPIYSLDYAIKQYLIWEQSQSECITDA